MFLPREPHEPASEALEGAIAVIGMAGHFAGAPNLDAFWQNLRDGVESIVPISDDELLAAGVAPALIRNPAYVKVCAPLGDMEMFDAGFFGLSPRDAAIMDPQHRHFLECAWEAIEDSAHPPERFPGSIAVFAGSGFGAYLPYNLLSNSRLVDEVGFFLLRHTGNDKDFLSTRVSYLLNLRGPSINVQTACSTSLVAIHMAVQSLLNRECDMALAGGVTIELPHRRGYLYEDGGVQAPDGHCRAFDASSQGTVFGSGAGAVVLRRLEDAVADGDHIYAVIRGSAVNNDGAGKVGYLAPSVDGQAHAITEALAIANITADTITYVEAHGTGTPVGEPIEIAALSQAFRQTTTDIGYCAIGSVKGNIGHTDTAAGVASFIKVALSLKHGELPPTLHFTAPNPACEFDSSPFYVNHTLKPWTPPLGQLRRAGVSSLGVGGTNSHVVLEQAPARRGQKSTRQHHLLTVSAKSPRALADNVAALGHYLAANPGIDFADVAFTLQIGRQQMSHRCSFVVSDTSEVADLLIGAKSSQLASGVSPPDGREIIFMFAGGGSQYPNMGLDLYNAEPVFREAVDECLETLALHSKLDIRKWLFPCTDDAEAAARALERPAIGLPALFTIQYAQAQLWLSWGLNPRAMIGHSLGEYMAAHLAGVFSLGDALDLVVLRGRLFESLPAGRMLSVPLGEAELRALLTPDLSIAAANGPLLTVASGPVDSIAALQAKLDDMDVPATLIPINIAAHSAMLAPILAEFGAFFHRLTLRAPRKPFISNVTGTWITPAEAVDPSYWVSQMRNTVRFADGIQMLLHDPNCVLLEVGPGRTLATLARSHPARQDTQPVFNSMRHPTERASDVAYVLDILGKLWTVGGAVSWGSFWQSEKRLRLPLPTYRFDRQRYWIEPGTAAAVVETDPNTLLERRVELDDWFYQPVWKRAVRPIVSPSTGTALVFQDDCGLADELAGQLAAAGRDVVRVRAGRRFSRSGRHVFTIDPSSPADYEALLSRLADDGRRVSEIYHLWSVTGKQRRQNSSDGAEAILRRGFYSLLYLAQAVGREDESLPIALAVVTDHLQRVAGETLVMPAKATIVGAGKVLAREIANLKLRSIDVILPSVSSSEMRELADDLIAENGSSDAADVVAYRAGERWLQDWSPVRLVRGGGRPSSLRRGGVYMITGGLGGIGLSLARHLAETVAARIVLVGRSGLPPREEWPSRTLGFDADDAIADRIRQVQAIEKLGGDVMIAGADVCNSAQMRHVVQQARVRFGAIDGVFHTAGIIDDGIAQMKDPQSAAAVLAPKVRGTLVLEEVFANEQIEFIMLFSSISANIGLAGQVDYAAANAFLDSYAQACGGQFGPRVIAVDWSQWQEVGMAAALASKSGLAPARVAPSRPTGHPLLGECLRDTPTERLFEAQLSPRTHWLLDEHRVAGGQALVPGAGFLEIVRAALARDGESRPIEITDVMFLTAFAVDDEARRTMRVQLRRSGEDRWQFSITGRPAESSDDCSWVEHVRGMVAHVDALRPQAVEMASMMARCRLGHRDGAPLSPQMRFGSRWQNVEATDFGNAEAVIRLMLPAAAADDLQTIALHPALLDLATAGAQTLVPENSDGRDFFVPASYRCVRLHAPLPAQIISHVRYRGNSGEPGIAVYDVTIIDTGGEVLAEILDFTMMRVAEGANFTQAASATRAAPRAISTANPVLSLGQEASILPSEGMAIIDRLLDARTGPQILVSPLDFVPLSRKLRAPAPVTVRPQATGNGAGGRALGGTPSTYTEILIAELWSEMLGVGEVGRDDNFFDLGGHSLLAVQLVNKLKKRTGTSLPLTALLEAPTVATLAELVAPGQTAEIRADSVATPVIPEVARPAMGPGLVRIRSGSGKPALYFVHDGLGETLLYRTLAMKLDPSHTVYGLQPEVRSDGSFPQITIADMAAAHVDRIRSVQSSGPYLLAGLCAGGVIAFEMARQLQDAGERTLFVGIIDAADVEAAERPFFVTRARLVSLFATLGTRGCEPFTRRLALFLPRAARKAYNLVAYEFAVRIDNARTARAVRRLQQKANRADSIAEGMAASVPGVMEPPSFLKTYRLAHRHHKPKGLFSGGDVVLFKATRSNGADDDGPFREQYSDCQLGWGKRVADEVRVIDIPGGHSSALQNPHVSTLAHTLQECVDAALAKVEVSTPPRSGADRIAAVTELVSG